MCCEYTVCPRPLYTESPNRYIIRDLDVRQCLQCILHDLGLREYIRLVLERDASKGVCIEALGVGVAERYLAAGRGERLPRLGNGRSGGLVASGLVAKGKAFERAGAAD